MDPKGKGPPTVKGSFVKPSKSVSLTVEVVASWIMTLEVATAGGRTKSKAQVNGNVCGLGFGPDMAVIAVVHGFGLRMRGRDAY